MYRCLAVVALSVAVFACESEAGFPVPTATPGPVSAQTQRVGDPVAGYEALVNAPYISCGLPYAAYEKIGDADPGAARLSGRAGLNADMPYYFTVASAASGVDVVSYNCLGCHAGELNGELIVGLGNSRFDATVDNAELAELVGFLVEGDDARAEWQRWVDRLTAIQPYTTAHTVGVNNAPNASAALMTFRDPATMAWSSTPLIAEPPKYVTPMKTPPWWRMKKKHGLYHVGSGRGDHAGHIMLATLMCSESVEELQVIDEYFADILAYVRSVEPPVYPFEIDAALAADGELVFEATCARCHGSNANYPNLTIALEEIGTDPLLADQGVRARDHYDWFTASFYGAQSYQLPVHGYYAPPLDAVWATAPYLHNASVPDILTLLDSPRRPDYWVRSGDYDPETLGVPYTTTHAKAQEPSSDAAAQIYDTTLPGYANTGHTFGDALSESERLAVLEYLKTL